MALQPLALSLLGVEPPPRRARTEGEDARMDGNEQGAAARPARSSRRATSYYNPFQTSCVVSNDAPPSYTIATRHRPAQRRSLDGGNEVLPGYTCTTAAEGRVWLNIESVSPLHGVAASEWREVHLVLRGTLLSFHKAKENGPGRLLRSYTLQHAEVGLAPDIQHVTLEPRTRLAHMIPSAARRRAWMKDPNMFEPVRQHSMRLRLETDQIVLAAPDEEQIHSLINAVSAGIDVSCAIDERTIPRQCTVPRRRRRHRQQQQPANLEDPSLLAEQERILRDMYPGFAEQTDGRPRLELGRTVTTITAGSTSDLPGGLLPPVSAEPRPTTARDEDEIDISAIREEAAEDSAPVTLQPRRPNYLRSITDTSVNTTFSAEMIYATSPDNFSESTGKWQPPHTRTPQQIQRYVKRCLPILLAESTRASDILICNGRRVRVNLRMEMLEEWELQPPSYRSHAFSKVQTGEEAERPASLSQNSVSGGSAENPAQTSTSEGEAESEDQITRAETGLANLELTKVTSLTATDKGILASKRRVEEEGRRDPAEDIHGVIFCF